MAGIYEDGQLGMATPQLNRDLPQGRIAIESFGIGAKASMDSSYLRDTCLVKTKECTFPQLNVGVQGILHQHGDVLSAEGFRQFRHRKGAGRGARSYPEGVKSCGKCVLDVAGRGHFRSHLHP